MTSLPTAGESLAERLRGLVREGIACRMFPAAVAYVSLGGMVVFHEAFGTLTYQPDSRATRLDDLFDLASLTKVFTTTVALGLVARGALTLDDPLTGLLPELSRPWSLADLLAHRTGTTANLLGEAFRAGIEPCQPGQEAALWRVLLRSEPAVPLRPGESHYSDIDLLLVQAACERAVGKRLDELLAAEVCRPLGLEETRFCPPEAERCVPTEVDERWRGGLVRGQVHDEMAATLGGVAGHAGLFSTARDVGRFCEAWLGQGPPLLPDELRRAALEPHSRDFGLGWRLCNESFFPELAAHGAVGHLGFTGTSAFLFPRRGLVFVLLTNRVYPSRDAAPSRLPLLGRMAKAILEGTEPA